MRAPRQQINFTFPSKSGWWHAFDRFCTARGWSRKRAVVQLVMDGLASRGFEPERLNCERCGVVNERIRGEECSLCKHIPAGEIWQRSPRRLQ